MHVTTPDIGLPQQRGEEEHSAICAFAAVPRIPLPDVLLIEMCPCQISEHDIPITTDVAVFVAEFEECTPAWVLLRPEALQIKLFESDSIAYRGEVELSVICPQIHSGANCVTTFDFSDCMTVSWRLSAFRSASVAQRSAQCHF